MTELIEVQKIKIKEYLNKNEIEELYIKNYGLRMQVMEQNNQEFIKHKQSLMKQMVHNNDFLTESII